MCLARLAANGPITAVSWDLARDQRTYAAESRTLEPTEYKPFRISKAMAYSQSRQLSNTVLQESTNL